LQIFSELSTEYLSSYGYEHQNVGGFSIPLPGSTHFSQTPKEALNFFVHYFLRSNSKILG